MRELPPPEIMEAVHTVGRWMAERNIKEWAIGSRASMEKSERMDAALTRIRIENVSAFDCKLIAAEAQGLIRI